MVPQRIQDVNKAVYNGRSLPAMCDNTSKHTGTEKMTVLPEEDLFAVHTQTITIVRLL